MDQEKFRFDYGAFMNKRFENDDGLSSPALQGRVRAKPTFSALNRAILKHLEESIGG